MQIPLKVVAHPMVRFPVNTIVFPDASPRAGWMVTDFALVGSFRLLMGVIALLVIPIFFSSIIS